MGSGSVHPVAVATETLALALALVSGLAGGWLPAGCWLAAAAGGGDWRRAGRQAQATQAEQAAAWLGDRRGGRKGGSGKRLNQCDLSAPRGPWSLGELSLNGGGSGNSLRIKKIQPKIALS